MNKTPQKIVFYDGDCGLCNRSVQLILRFEKHSEIHFCTLQSKFAERYFEERNLPQLDLNTFFYSENGVLYQKSEAAFRTAKNLRFPYSVLHVFLILPQWLMDKAYDLVARYRKKIAGNYCVVPSTKQKKRFIS